MFKKGVRFCYEWGNEAKIPLLLLLICLILPLALFSQRDSDIVLTGISAEYDDSFREWYIYTADGTRGEITMRWPLENDWSTWDYRIGEHSGSIAVKWPLQYSLWEVRGFNNLVTVKRVWSNSINEWEVKSPELQFGIESRYGNYFEEWQLDRSRYGDLYYYTWYEGDLRDWVIADEMDPSVPIEAKIGAVFVPIISAIINLL